MLILTFKEPIQASENCDRKGSHVIRITSKRLPKLRISTTNDFWREFQTLRFGIRMKIRLLLEYNIYIPLKSYPVEETQVKVCKRELETAIDTANRSQSQLCTFPRWRDVFATPRFLSTSPPSLSYHIIPNLIHHSSPSPITVSSSSVVPLIWYISLFCASFSFFAYSAAALTRISFVK